MFLKEIEIIGFKSFADKTKLRFSPGITGIVGPNGCGKSNISDAFRWVFGEQSAKSLRGHKMPDVIFAGTTTRKALNFAEVTITFSDIQGALPIDYEEVAVTRRLHRSGDSEYFINRHPVRLKDIQSLFLDSGMGKDAYSIFEQGKIDQIINYSPMERRYIFEEAAGILRFLQRKREALRKLEQADLNVARLKDIHKEVEAQISVLQRQAEEANAYQANQKSLVELEKALLFARFENVEQREKESRKKESDLLRAIEEQERALEARREELKSAKIHLQEQEKVYRQRSEEVFKTRSDKEIKSREKLSHQERLKEAIVKEKRWIQELEFIVAKREGRLSEAKTLQKQQTGLEADLITHENTLKGMREAFQKSETGVVTMRGRQQAGQQELFKLMQKENQLGSELKQAKTRHEAALEQKGQTLDRQRRLDQQRKELQQTVEEKQKAQKELSEEIDRQRARFDAIEKEIQAIVEGLQSEQADFDSLAKERGEGRARQKVLLRLRDEKEGFSSGSKRLLQESADSKSPLFDKLRPLCELVAIETADMTPLAASLRSYSQTLVVASWSDFDQVVAFASANNLKDYSLLCLEGLETHTKMTLPKNLKPLVVAKDPLAGHFFNSLLSGKEREKALAWIVSHPEAEVWLEEGALVDRRQVFFYYAPSESHAFVREAELKTLQQRLEELDALCLKAESALQNLQKERSRKLSEKVEQDKMVRKTEMRLIEVNFALQRASGDFERVQLELNQLQVNLQQFVATLEKLEAVIQELERQHGEAKNGSQEAREEQFKIERELEDQITLMKREQQLLREKETLFQKISDENRRALHALHVHEVKDLESVQQEKRLEEEIVAIREFQSQMKTKTGEQELLLADVETLLSKVTEATTHVEKEVAKKRGAVEENEKRLQSQEAQLKKGEEQRHQVALQLAQIETSRTALAEDLGVRYRTTFEALKTEPLPIIKSIEQAEKQIRALKGTQEAAGAINMTAIEECAKQQERYTFLNQQMDDMALSKKELGEIIAELDGESRKQFQETFEQIRANFQKNFALLFQGGEADLQFTETTDLLEAGIEIIARPPAKQMRSIQLLSGGEKCLTAMALLFAIFEVKPSPFCILDEIDAPLDDANVERFVRVVQQFVSRTQFLIITHNKRTMAIADMLFGVSMEEKGISKILSMEFARQPAPQLV